MKFSTEGLQAVGRDLCAPFMVEVTLDPSEDVDSPVKSQLHFASVARILPDRRVSGLATHEGQPVFAKLFFGANARRYWQRELNGARLLHKAAIPTPAVLDQGATADGRGYVVLYEALTEAQDLSPDNHEDVYAAIDLLAQLHNANLVQSDLHIHNFLRCQGKYFVIDADGISKAHLLRQQFANLGVFLAQRPPTEDKDIEDVWAAYSTARGAYVNRMGSASALVKMTHRQRALRVRRYLKKTQRSCTEFVHKRTFSYDFVCDREYWPQLQRFMLFADAMVGEGTPLKLGNSSTVVRIELEGQRFIVKRYNIKSVTHRIRRWFKKRARIAWKNGHHLSFLGIHTARPLALLEAKWGWFNDVCYLVMPDVGERNLGQALSSDERCFDRVAEPTLSRLTGLQAAGLAHGDLKATNFVLSADDVMLIDYDAVHSGDNTADMNRFLANWADRPDLQARWRSACQQAGLI